MFGGEMPYGQLQRWFVSVQTSEYSPYSGRAIDGMMGLRTFLRKVLSGKKVNNSRLTKHGCER